MLTYAGKVLLPARMSLSYPWFSFPDVSLQGICGALLVLALTAAAALAGAKSRNWRLVELAIFLYFAQRDKQRRRSEEAFLRARQILLAGNVSHDDADFRHAVLDVGTAFFDPGESAKPNFWRLSRDCLLLSKDTNLKSTTIPGKPLSLTLVQLPAILPGTRTNAWHFSFFLRVFAHGQRA